MNDIVLTQLKILVERAVRPVRASSAHKQKIREELLAHVSAVFVEETDRLGNEAAALERTAQRFGPPAELTRQLQQAVPRRDAAARLAEDLFGAGTSRSTWRRSLRHALVAGLLCAGAWGLIVTVVSLLFFERLRAWHTLVVPLSGIAGLCVFVAGLLFLAHWMHDALYGPRGRSWQRTALIAAASGLLLPLVTFAVCFGWSGDAWSSLRDVAPLGVLALVLTPLIVAAMAWQLGVEMRAHEEWASLPID